MKADKAPALSVRGLRKAFAGNEVLRGVDLETPDAAIALLLGKSGGGKTVLLKCIAGLLAADAGAVSLHGQRVEGTHRPGLAYLFQGDALFDSLTTAQNVALPLVEGGRLTRADAAEKVAAMLDELDLSEAADRYPSQLSGGMRRRVALARALVTRPRLLLFDEPTAGLDPARRRAVLEMILSDRERFGFTALLVSHDIAEALLISDLVAVLDQGRIAFTGTPREFRASSSDLAKEFLGGEERLAAAVQRIRRRP